MTEPLPIAPRRPSSGAKGTRTPNPLLAKQVRYQLRHGPWVPTPRPARRSADGPRPRLRRCGADVVRGLGPKLLLGALVADLLLDHDGAGGDDGHDEQLLE